jgi:hypothetical protein
VPAGGPGAPAGTILLKDATAPTIGCLDGATNFRRKGRRLTGADPGS